MAESKRLGAGPSVLLAAGVIASSFVAWALSDSPWLAMSGGVIMAATLIGASVLNPQREAVRRYAVARACTLGGFLLLGSAIVVMVNPGWLAPVMPILGGGAAAAVLTSGYKGATS